MQYETVIGLEVHAQLKTNTKIFCGCKNQFGAPPNTQTCPVCLGMPGVLPVTNKKAVEYAIKIGLAVHCQINEHSIFARKNYFYPDLPKGYQISQYEEPICGHGCVMIPTESGEEKKIRILRIHLEEDAGKSIHDEAFVGAAESLVDLNRCGTPLIEIVTEPDIRSPREAFEYLQKIRQLVRWLDICDGNMEEGSLRCDANISIRPPGETKLGTKTELKNMNSFRGVEKALAYEVKRQTAILETGGTIVQETLLWDESIGQVQPMRSKEEAHDYRYFPDPDLVPVLVDEKWKASIHNKLPELPDARKKRWLQEYKLSDYNATVLNNDRSVSEFYEAVVAEVKDPKQAANWTMGEVLRILNDEKAEIDTLNLTPVTLGQIIQMVDKGIISGSAAKKVIHEVCDTGISPAEIVKKLGLVQISDEGDLEKVVDEIIVSHPNEVERYLGGHNKLFGFFIGQAMKATRGKGNPQLLNKLLNEKLQEQK